MRREKIAKFGIFRGNFPNPKQRRLTKPWSKIFVLDPSLALIERRKQQKFHSTNFK